MVMDLTILDKERASYNFVNTIFFNGTITPNLPITEAKFYRLNTPMCSYPLVTMRSFVLKAVSSESITILAKPSYSRQRFWFS